VEGKGGEGRGGEEKERAMSPPPLFGGSLRLCCCRPKACLTLGVRRSNLSGMTPANSNHSGPNLADLSRSRGDNV